MFTCIPIQRAPLTNLIWVLFLNFLPSIKCLICTHTHRDHTHTHTHFFLKIIVCVLHRERLCSLFQSYSKSFSFSQHFISYWLSVIMSSSGSTAFALLVILERCVTWMWTSVKFHLAYTRASVSTRPGVSSASVVLDTQVALLPSGDTKINMRV